MQVEKMHVAKIQIRNILGIESLEVEPGKITEISGQNGVGKTSVLKAIQGVLGGGHDGKLLRNGEDEGEIVLIFDNGERLRKTMTRYKSEVHFENAEGKKIKQGASYLKEIIDTVGLNPIQILTADRKTRIKLLLNSVPMPMPVDEIKFISGLDRTDKDGHPLAVIEDIRKDIFEERAFINKEAQEKEIVVSKMRETLPFDGGRGEKTDWALEVGTLRTELEKLVKSHDEDVIKAKTDLGDFLTKKEREANVQITAIQAELNDSMASAKENHQEFMDRRRLEYDDEANPVKEKIQKAAINSENQQKISGTMEFIETAKQEIKILEKNAKKHSDEISDLDKLKGELMENLPVKGLTVYDGDIYIDDVPFDTLNEAARIRFCLMIAGLRKTKLPLVCVDGLENLDQERFKIFKDEAEKTDMQFFFSRVSEDENLTIN